MQHLPHCHTSGKIQWTPHQYKGHLWTLCTNPPPVSTVLAQLCRCCERHRCWFWWLFDAWGFLPALGWITCHLFYNHRWSREEVVSSTVKCLTYGRSGCRRCWTSSPGHLLESFLPIYQNQLHSWMNIGRQWCLIFSEGWYPQSYLVFCVRIRTGIIQVGHIHWLQTSRDVLYLSRQEYVFLHRILPLSFCIGGRLLWLERVDKA